MDTSKIIKKQEENIEMQTKIIAKQEKSIADQKNWIAELEKNIKKQEASLENHMKHADIQSKNIQNEKGEIQKLENRIHKKKTGTESTDGENTDKDRELSKGIEELRTILRMQEMVVGEQRNTVKEQKENIDKQRILNEEPKRNIEEQEKNIAKQRRNINEQEEIIKKLKIFLKDLNNIIEVQSKHIEERTKAMKDEETRKLSNYCHEIIEDLNGHLEKMKKIIEKQNEIISDRNNTVNVPNDDQEVNSKKNDALKFATVALIVAAFLFKWCNEFKDKTCAKKAALNTLGISFSCQHLDIKEELKNILPLAIASMVLYGLMWVFQVCLLSLIHRKKGSLFFYAPFAIAAFVLSWVLLGKYDILSELKKKQSSTDYNKLKKVMLQSLTKNYTSDVITSSDIMAKKWNTFFIAYDCCAVNQVLGTTNDFDTTPWCTTSGTCQQTNSQIPKTCCKDVTENDYLNATNTCHETVKEGTYKEGCLNRIKSLSDVSIQDYQIDGLCALVLTLGILNLAAIFLVSIEPITYMICSSIKIKKLCRLNPEQ